MDLVLRGDSGQYETLWLEQAELGRLLKQAQAQSRCACVHASREAKLKNLRPVS
jgi:hypothetical protein